MTMLEVMIASSISVAVMLAVFATSLIVMREQRTSLVALSHIRHVNEIEEEIRSHLLLMDRGGSLILPAPLFGVEFVQFQRSEAANPELLRWDDAAGELRHYPNANDQDTFTVIGEHGGGRSSFIESVEFSLNRDLDGNIDAGVIQVDMEVSDRGTQRHAAGEQRYFRSFWVNIRGL